MTFTLHIHKDNKVYEIERRVNNIWKSETTNSKFFLYKDNTGIRVSETEVMNLLGDFYNDL